MSRITLNQLPEPVKPGQVHPKDYWNDGYFKELEPLVAHLKEQVPEAKYDSKSLVFMLVQLLHFQEGALGKEAMPPKPVPKLPIKLLTNPSVGGALHAIALKLFDIRRARGLKAIEWQNPGRRKECMEVLLVLRRELERQNLLRVPHVHISDACGTEVQRLREYVRRLQGQLAESPDEPGVTHVVHPFGPKGDPDDGKEYTTVVAVKGPQARVHYWYTPDSYDSWIPLSSVDSKEVQADRSPPGGVWKVTPRWIIDSEKFNEWMNPADYTTPEMDAEMEAAEADAKGTKRQGASLTGQAKKARSDTHEVAPEPLSVLGPTARLRQVLQPHKGLTDSAQQSVENLSMGHINNHMAAYQPALPPIAPQQQQSQSQPQQQQADTVAGGSDSQQQQASKQQQQQQEAVRRPAHNMAAVFGVGAAAGWFKPDAVHQVERGAMPEFFSAERSALYKECRDAMLSLYWEQPERELAFETVRQHIDGEVNDLRKIYEFLQFWGLINPTANSTLPLAGVGAGAGFNSNPYAAVPVGPGLSARMPPGTASLYQFKNPSQLEATAAAQCGGPYGHVAATAAAGDVSRLLYPLAGFKSAQEGLNPSCLTRIHCSAMPWVDCTELRYNCTKFPDVNLCPQAFAEGRFPPGVSSRDFVRVDGRQRHNSTDGWTPEETMLLLEGLELYKEDWEKIASHVGKSQSACLTHFVRLPIDDPCLDDLVHWTTAAPTAANKQQGAGGAAGASAGAGGASAASSKLPPLPFLDEPNPVLSTLGVLSHIMGPKVAAAAAQAALQVLAEGDTAAGEVLNPEVRLAAVLAAAKQGSAAAAGDGGGEQEQQQNGDAHMQDADGQQQQRQTAAAAANVDPQRPIDRSLIASAVAAALAAAATRAQQLAVVEEREIQRLMVGLVDVATRKVDAKVNLLQQLMDPPGLDREKGQAELSLKQLQADSATFSAQLEKARVAKQQQDEAKQKAEAAKKQQAEAAARQKAALMAAAAQQQQQQQQQAAAAARAASASQQPQQQPQQQAPSMPLPPGAAAAAGGVQPSSQQQQQQPQQQQLSQQQQQQTTPAKSNVSTLSSQGGGATTPGGADSSMMLGDDEDDDGDLGELLGDIGDDEDDGMEDEEMDMP